MRVQTEIQRLQFYWPMAMRKINFCPYLHPSFAGALGALYRADVIDPAIRALAKTSQSGGIGRRARLKIVYLRMCGFDSHLWYPFILNRLCDSKKLQGLFYGSSITTIWAVPVLGGAGEYPGYDDIH